MSNEAIIIRPVGEPGDLGWMIMAHGEIYAHEFGWNADMETLIARIVAEYATDHDPTREAAWIAELEGRRVGCVLCVAADAQTAQLRILLVDPAARGHGVGTRLVDECLAFARRVGYTRMKLWTNHPLEAARRIYLSRGFALVEEEPHHSFGVDLVGQTYKLDLGGGAAVAGRGLGEGVAGAAEVGDGVAGAAEAGDGAAGAAEAGGHAGAVRSSIRLPQGSSA